MVRKEYKIPKSQENYIQYIDLRDEWDINIVLLWTRDDVYNRHFFKMVKNILSF